MIWDKIMKHIGLITYRKLPLLAADDQILMKELTARGHQVSPVVWDDESMQLSGFDFLVIRSCWDYYLRLPEFLSWIEKIQSAGIRLINPPETVRWNSNKTYLRELKERGVPMPQSVYLNKSDLESLADTLRRVFDETGWTKGVLKPLVSAGAHETFVLEGSEVLTLKLPRLNPLSAGYILQEFLPEIHDPGEYSFLFFGGKFSHALRKKPKAGDFRVQPEHGGITTAHLPTARQLSQVMEILAHVPVKFSYARVDTVERAGELLLMELELIEPNLFFSTSVGSEKKFADAILQEMLIEPIRQTE